ncbi:hypothetical protein PALI_a3404 [Pseudoalteromonas aliena SW19]|uniref:Uncharacterized protein n=1 Tax=Pseudoalteromonas aliena SW19 TaxID=1314866 RepID=A0ABR9DTU6_9GAMM|nr:hypothetical protein [Pseudoalteromonas aliena SW19]
MLIPRVNINGRVSVRSLFGFWFCYFVNHSWTLVWRMSLLLCVFMASTTLVAERADLVNVLYAVAMAFIILFCSSLQFDCAKVYAQYCLFFKTCQKARTFYISQFIPRACLSFEVKFAADCLVFRQGRAYVVWLFPINRR